MNEVLATLGVPLDGRFSSIRTSETNLGNLICDIMIAATDSDLALLNSGTLRSDRIHETGAFTLRDLNNILPMLDPLVVIEVTGGLHYNHFLNHLIYFQSTAISDQFQSNFL